MTKSHFHSAAELVTRTQYKQITYKLIKVYLNTNKKCSF